MEGASRRAAGREREKLVGVLLATRGGQRTAEDRRAIAASPNGFYEVMSREPLFISVAQCRLVDTVISGWRQLRVGRSFHILSGFTVALF